MPQVGKGNPGAHDHRSKAGGIIGESLLSGVVTEAEGDTDAPESIPGALGDAGKFILFEITCSDTIET